MSRLPDLEGLAIFARVVELRSFAGAAQDLGLSKATVSKAVTRLEARIGARLFNRTSRRLALTDAGRSLAERAARVLAEAEAAETEAMEQSAAPRGLVRLAAPMSFGVTVVAPVLPDFLRDYPGVSVDLSLDDAVVDLVGSGFDLALRIAALPDSSLIARRIRTVDRHLVASQTYLDRHGTPAHPAQLADHACLGYAFNPTPETWRFQNARTGESFTVRQAGPMRTNNGTALMPALESGIGLAVLPDFICGEALAAGRLTAVLAEWGPPPIALHLVSPSSGPRPARVEALADFLIARLARRA